MKGFGGTGGGWAGLQSGMQSQHRVQGGRRELRRSGGREDRRESGKRIWSGRREGVRVPRRGGAEESEVKRRLLMVAGESQTAGTSPAWCRREHDMSLG